MSERAAFTIIFGLLSLNFFLDLVRDRSPACHRAAAEVLAPENVCRALDHTWIELGAGQGECLTKEMLARLGVK